MNGRNAAYWTTTALAVTSLLVGGLAYLSRVDEVVENLASLGYPGYLLTILGVCKIVAGTVIAAPRFPRLKEWAYAGVAVNLLGAAISHAATGHPAAKIAPPLIAFGVTMASWWLRPSSRSYAPTAKVVREGAQGVLAPEPSSALR
jgi:hypothetical protein